MVEPGVVKLAGKNGTMVFGEPDGSMSPRLMAIAELFKAAGLPVVASDRVPGDGAVVPGHVNFMSLKKSPAAWARKIAELADGWQRTDASAFIREAGLDIVRNAEKLQELYLSQGGEA